MKVVDVNGNTLNRDTLDLTKGYLVKGKIPKSDAIPIDNVVKFAWEDSDFEEVEIYKIKREYNESPLEKVLDLKIKLQDTDYVVIKIMEGAATEEEYSNIIEQRKKWRDQINILQHQFNLLGGN